MKTYSRKRSFKKMKYMDELCRLCLSCDGEKQHIFSGCEDESLPLKIMACVSIEVFEGDGLPSEICQQCLEQVENCYRFRQKCENTDTKLRQLLKNIKDEDLPEKVPPDQEGGSDLHLLSEGSSGRGKTRNEANLKRVLYELLSDVNNPCKDMKYPDPNSADDNHTTLILDCEDRNDELDNTLLQDDHLNLIHNIHNVVESPDSSKRTSMARENTEEQRCKWNENVNYSQEISETIVADMQTMENNRVMIIKPDPGEEKKRSASTDSNYILPEILHHSTVNAVIENTVNPGTSDSNSYISSSESNEQNTGESSKQVTTSKLVQLETVTTNLLFTCSKCPKRFAKGIDLRRHSSVHDEQRGFSCGVCEKWFPNRTSFRRHERIHTGERPFMCPICEKRFSQEAILSRHILTHTGRKPYKCEICDKAFTQREGLRIHMRQHSDTKPEIQQFYCPLCEKSFCHQSGLSRHLIIHSGKTFDCTTCTKTFTDQSSLRRHMRRHIVNQNTVLP